MKKLLLLLLLSLPMVVLAQGDGQWVYKKYSTWDKKYKNSLSFDFGITPLIYDTHEVMHYNYDYSPYGTSSWCGYEAADLYKGSDTYFPSLNFTYNYRLSKLFSIEMVMGYARTESSYFDRFDGGFAFKESNSYLHLMPVGKLHWLNQRMISLYSAFGLGVSFSSSRNEDGRLGRDNFQTLPIIHTALIGARFGYRAFGFAEFGPSMIGVLRLGIGYRF